jgi:histidinol dehydrogenase
VTEGLLSLVDLRALARPVALGDLPSPAESDLAEVAARARAIIDQVRRGGDEALLRLTGELDGVVPERLVLGPEDFEEAYGRLEEGLRAALTKAHARIVALHQAELPVATKVQSDGITVVRRHLPVASAGCYVPGGTARYPSSVLHTAAIARVAGVPRVVVATPPTSSGGIDRATLAACFVAGVDAAYPVGGAQAIAALAYGTETIEQTGKKRNKRMKYKKKIEERYKV